MGATSTASWWAHATKQTRAEAHRKMRLARAMDRDHEPVGDALFAGRLLTDQADVIVRAVDELPRDLVDPELVQRAELHLVGLARHHDAKELKVLGAAVLEHLAPEIAEAHEQAQLDREEKQAAQSARFTMSDDGHGRSHGRFTLPTMQAEMLRKHLLALASPRRTSDAGAGTGGTPPGEQKPLPHRMGLAFLEYVQRYPSDHVPQSGGVAATVVVTMTLETLMGGLASAALDTGAHISAGEARRLACEAGSIPAVLGGAGQVLDLGRKRRFHSEPQRIALGLRDGGCTTEGCDWPPGLCHAHHDPPWSAGGITDVDRGRLLCPHHHARAHDPTYRTTRLPGGKVAFTRRT
ncbi:hypothetical protein GCM10009844_12380 [Nocardioides koreensis]|uniref:HNH nuclease domain-containing protein n=1 Tax=Nocardioides koreensis TaxID=433651 RepID=A0ABN2ZGA2_9ACTN